MKRFLLIFSLEGLFSLHLATCLAQFPEPTATDKHRFHELPLVLIASTGSPLPSIGAPPALLDAKFIEDSVIFVAANQNDNGIGIYHGNGATPEVIAEQNQAIPGLGYPPQHFGWSLSHHTSPEIQSVYVVTGAEGQTAIVQTTDGPNILKIVTERDIMPGSEGLRFTGFGEIHTSGSKIVFSGEHRVRGREEPFRGIYLWEQGVISRFIDSSNVADDPNHAVPLDLHFGFDSETIAFIGRGSKSNTTGVFKKALNGPIIPVLMKGDEIPGTKYSITTFQSPPVVDNGDVYFQATGTNSASRTFILKESNGTLKKIAGDADPIPSKGQFFGIPLYQIDRIGTLNFQVYDGEVFFSASHKTTQSSGLRAREGDGIYVADGETIRIVVEDKDFKEEHECDTRFELDSREIPFLRRIRYILRDVSNKGIIFERTNGQGTNCLLAALEKPGTPVILKEPSFIDPWGNPFPIDLNPGQALKLDVTAVGPESMEMQWYRDGKVIPGQQSPTLEIPHVTKQHVGLYSLKLIANGIQRSTKEVYVYLNTRPEILVDIDDQVVETAGDIELSIEASGKTPLSYQWFHNGVELKTDSRSSSLSFRQVSADRTGNYHVIISNDLGSTVSRTAWVQVAPPPPNAEYNGRPFKAVLSPGHAIPNVTDRAVVSSAVTSTQSRHLAVSLTIADQNEATITARIGIDGRIKKLHSLTEFNATLGTNLIGFHSAPFFDPTGQVYHILASNSAGFTSLVSAGPNGIELTTGPVSPAREQDHGTLNPSAIHHVGDDGTVIVSARMGDRTGLFKVHNRQITPLINEKILLPENFGTGTAIGFEGYHDQTLFFSKAWNNLSISDQFKLGRPQFPHFGIFSQNSDGEIHLLGQVDQEIPGTSNQLIQTGSIHASNGGLYTFANSSAGRFRTQILVKLNADGFQVVTPNPDRIPDDTSFRFVHSASSFGSNEPLLLTASVSLPMSDLPNRRILTFQNNQLNPVLLSPVLDGFPFDVARVLAYDHASKTVFFRASHWAGQGVIYANVPNEESPQDPVPSPLLALPTINGKTMQFSVPDGFVLQESDRVGGSHWITTSPAINGIVTVTLDPAKPKRFFRLRQAR